MSDDNEKMVETPEEEHIKRRCLIVRSNGEMKEELVDLQDQDSLKQLFNYELVYIGEIENSKICILGGESEELPENNLGIVLNPPRDHLYGDLLAFKTNDDGEPIDLTETMFKRAVKKNRKRMNKAEAAAMKEEQEDNNEEEENDNDNGTNSEDNKCNIYLDGFPYETTEEDIYTFFSDIRDHITNLHMPKYQDSGRSRGYAHILLDDPKYVEQALAKNGQYIGDRYVRVQQANGQKSNVPTTNKNVTLPANCNSVFLKNLPYECTEEEIQEVFKVYGPITSVRVPRWPQTGRTKGIAYITYKREDSVLQAVKKSGTITMNNRSIFVDFETGKPKASFRDKDGKYWNKSNEEKKKNPKRPTLKAKTDKKVHL